MVARTVTAPHVLGLAVHHAKATITHAQILTLRATPVTLVPAPGAGRAIVVESVDLLLDAAAGAYTETADNLVVEYSGGTDIVTIETTGFIDQASAEPRTIQPAVALTEPVPNEAVRIANSGDGEFGGGNAANSLTVTVRYRIVAAS